MALFNKVDVFMEYDVFKMVFPLTTNPFMTDLAIEKIYGQYAKEACLP